MTKQNTTQTANAQPENVPTYIKLPNGKYVPRLYTPTEPRCFRVIRFYRDSYRKRTIKSSLTKAEAQAHCSREDTRGNGWFDGYDYMKGCRPSGQ